MEQFSFRLIREILLQAQRFFFGNENQSGKLFSERCAIFSLTFKASKSARLNLEKLTAADVRTVSLISAQTKDLWSLSWFFSLDPFLKYFVLL